MADINLRNLWEGRIEDWKKSGKSIVQWCKENNLPDHQFYYWRDRLNGKRRGKSAPRSSTGGFIELVDCDHNESGVVIRTAGVEVHIKPKFDENTLLRCLRLLGSKS